MSVLDLKVAISKELNIGLEELIFKRGTHGTEIKEDDLSLKAASLYNKIWIYIKRGTPSLENEKRLQFLLAETMTEADKALLDPPTADNLYYKMRELIEIPVNTHQTTLKVKKYLCEKVKEKCQIELDPSRIRLREKGNDRLTKVYHDDVILEQYKMYESKPIAIQSLKDHEEVDPDSILIMLRCWNPSTWALSEMKEIIVKRYSTMDNFSYVINREFPWLERKNIECCKIMTNFFRVQLPYEKWYGLIDSEDFLASNPLYLSTDGLLIIVKDNSEPERELTEEEKKEFGWAEYENAIFVTTKGGKKGYVAKEKAMKINVKKKKKLPFDGEIEVLVPESKQEENKEWQDKEMKEEVNGTIYLETNDSNMNGDKMKYEDGIKDQILLDGNANNGHSNDVHMEDQS
jgi:hypothetical protein